MLWIARLLITSVQDCLTAGQVKRLHALGANVTLLNAKSQVPVPTIYISTCLPPLDNFGAKLNKYLLEFCSTYYLTS